MAYYYSGITFRGTGEILAYCTLAHTERDYGTLQHDVFACVFKETVLVHGGMLSI